MTKKLPIINIEDVDAFIDNYSGFNVQISDWFEHNAKNFLLSNLSDTVPYMNGDYTRQVISLPKWAKISLEKKQPLYMFYPSPETKDNFSRIHDFLYSPDSEHLLHRLRRISAPQMLELEKEWLIKLSKQDVVEVDETHYKVIYDFSNGYRIIELLTPLSKDEEGTLMGHCVGQGGYDNETILSLRDKDNKPHATMQVRDNTIQQLQGKQNTAVVEKYTKYLREFILSSGYDATDYCLERFKDCGLIRINKLIYDMNDLPENFAITLLDFRKVECRKLPNGLAILSDLIIVDSSLSLIPKGLYVKGDFIIVKTGIKVLPQDLRAKCICTDDKDLYESYNNKFNMFLIEEEDAKNMLACVSKKRKKTEEV